MQYNTLGKKCTEWIHQLTRSDILGNKLYSYNSNCHNLTYTTPHVQLEFCKAD